MGNILKRHIIGFSILILLMIIGACILCVYEVTSTQVNEWNAKKFVYGFIVELQENDYESLSSMMFLEGTQTVTAESAKEYIEELEFDKLKELDLQVELTGVSAHVDGQETAVHFYEDGISYRFVCTKIESDWKIVSLDHEFF